jgi:hypothetical protein
MQFYRAAAFGGQGEMKDGASRLCRENDRVCPLPPMWHRLWKMLPNRTQSGAGSQPPPPLILAAVARDTGDA